MKERFLSHIPASDKFQIFVSRIYEPLDQDKIRIYWAHDLPGDPSANFLLNEGWKQFHALVFVSYWQMHAFINFYGIHDHTRCHVIENCISADQEKELNESHTISDLDKDRIQIGYWSTPHRGLNILVPVFQRLANKYPITLNVFSSFKIYGWEQRDEPYKDLFNQCIEDPNINYYGTVSNEEVFSRIKNYDIFALPSIWPETSCIALIEAMVNGLICVHSDLGALPETSLKANVMYRYQTDIMDHASMFYTYLEAAIQNFQQLKSMSEITKYVARNAYSHAAFTNKWIMLLNQLTSSRA